MLLFIYLYFLEWETEETTDLERGVLNGLVGWLVGWMGMGIYNINPSQLVYSC